MIYWDSSIFLHYIEGTQEWMPAARSLLRRSAEIGRSLKPMDAIHLATAELMQVAEFHTTDGKLKNWNDLGFPVQDPYTPRPKLPL
jgi:predicted nucleic acid-binding protein